MNTHSYHHARKFQNFGLMPTFILSAIRRRAVVAMIFSLSMVSVLAFASSVSAASLFPPSSVPSMPAASDSSAVELGVRFTSDVVGSVTAIRFYKGTTNTGTHTGKLWAASNGALLGSVTFANETSSGWQQMNFSSPIAIAANTQYIASYHTNIGHYSFDQNYFSTAVDNPPLHAPASTNGVYRYGASAFPSSTYFASNYWVDLVFTATTTPPDTTPPSVSVTNPLDGTMASSTITVSATASDNVGVAGVQFLLDGANLGVEDTVSPYSILWDTVTVSNGSHTLLARARDAAGNRATSTPVAVTVNNVPDTTPPTVSITAPADGSTASSTITVSATASDNVGVAGVQFLLDGANLGAEDMTSPYSISWNSSTTPNGAHTLSARARDAAGNTATSSAVSVMVANGIVPTQGPGGPILIVASGSNPFSTYYKEILLAEGFNMYRMIDISSVTAADLASYDVVILGEMSLTPDQTTMFTDWVTGGGNLIAMRPSVSLTNLLGLTSQNASTSNAYFRVNTAVAPGTGIVASSMQFHGAADRYTLNGATEIATLYSNISTSLNIPAVTNRAVGASGGHAAAFAFDLARSVVYTRQGNPAWSGQDRRIDTAETGSTLIRPMDLFYGAASFDPQPDWVDFANIQIPQADETQRLLGNMIQNILSAKKPLPHFWYLPRGEKAAVVMTGDDHANGGTAGRFDQYLSQSAPGCNVADWECIRSTSYIFPNSPLTNAQAASYVAQGFEVALHPNAGCQNPVNLASAFANDFSAFASSYPGVPAPRTIRTHCGPWPDYDTHSKLAAENYAVRFDTNYYYWPPAWMQDRPGLFTGSGLPMRFTDRNGNIIDAYQAPTQLTDESGQSYPLHINTLLDNALGPQGYYGMFVLNAHTDYASSAVSDAVVASAQTHGVHMISAAQALDWLDGRNNSSLGAIAWNAASTTLSFTISQDVRARGLTTLIPASFSGAPLATLTRNGTPVSFSTLVIKGISYAQFASDAGAYQAIYTVDTTPPDTTPPTVPTNLTATPISSSQINLAWTASTDNVGVTGYKVFRGGSQIATSTVTSYSNTGLASSTLYTYGVSAFDAAGNVSALSASVSTTTFAASTSTPPVTVTFDNPAPPGSSFSYLNGVFQGIDFGTNSWRWEGPYGVDPTNNIFFDSSSGTSRMFTFSPGPRVLMSMRVFSSSNGTLTLTDNLGQTKTQTITTDSMQTVATNWVQPSTTITVSFTNGWNIGVDDIVYQ